jgi:hypothetical protein
MNTTPCFLPAGQLLHGRPSRTARKRYYSAYVRLWSILALVRPIIAMKTEFVLFLLNYVRARHVLTISRLWQRVFRTRPERPVSCGWDLGVVKHVDPRARTPLSLLWQGAELAAGCRLQCRATCSIGLALAWLHVYYDQPHCWHDPCRQYWGALSASPQIWAATTHALVARYGLYWASRYNGSRASSLGDDQ